MFKPALPSLLFALLLGLLTWRESHQPWLEPAQRGFTEWLAANAGLKLPAAPLTLVEINDSTLSADHPWPWLPLDYAIFLSTVEPLKPEVTAIEPTLAFGPNLSPDDAQYLHAVHDKILALPKVLLSEKPGFPEDPDLVPPLEAVPVIRKVEGSIEKIPEYTVIAARPVEDLRLSAAMGFTDPSSAPSPLSVPLVYRYHGEIVPSFALQAVVLWAAATLDEVQVAPGQFIAIGSKLRLPIDDAGRLEINPDVPYARVGNDDLLLRVTQMQNQQPSPYQPGAFAKQIALLSRTDKAARTITASTDQKISPGELTAAAIATMTTQAFSREVTWPWEIGICAALAWFAACVIRWPRERAVLTVFGVLLGYLVIALSLYQFKLLALPFTTPAILGLLALINAAFNPARLRRGHPGRVRKKRRQPYY
jgi:hypothetical protein